MQDRCEKLLARKSGSVLCLYDKCEAALQCWVTEDVLFQSLQQKSSREQELQDKLRKLETEKNDLSNKLTALQVRLSYHDVSLYNIISEVSHIRV